MITSRVTNTIIILPIMYPIEKYYIFLTHASGLYPIIKITAKTYSVFILSLPNIAFKASRVNDIWAIVNEN